MEGKKPLEPEPEALRIGDTNEPIPESDEKPEQPLSPYPQLRLLQPLPQLEKNPVGFVLIPGRL